MLVGNLSKTPFEVLNCSVDFGPEATPGDILLISSVTATLAGQNQTSAVISTSPPPIMSGAIALWQIFGGVFGSHYVVSVKTIGAPSGEHHEASVNLFIESE